jgi:hypothetical protein
MKHLKTFEFFAYGQPNMGREEDDDNVYLSHESEEEITVPPFGEEQEEDGCDSCGCEACECGSPNSGQMGYPNKYSEEEEEEEEMMPSEIEIMKFEAKKTSKKAKPDFLDLDKDGDKKETMKKAAADKKKSEKGKDSKEDKKDEKAPKGKLSKAQEKLPPALKKAIAQGIRD